jgi:hypothetical protein
MAQAVEHLLCKHKALSSNLTPTKKTVIQVPSSLIRLAPYPHYSHMLQE